jgi:hypothetical protein
LDENGRRVEGGTKNKYSRRTIKLTPVMFEALEKEKGFTISSKANPSSTIPPGVL